MPVDFLVTGGQVNDCTQAIELLGERKAECVLADKGYDSQAILDHIQAMGAVAVVPSKSNRRQQRTHDKELYRKRNRNRIDAFLNSNTSAASPHATKDSNRTSKLSSQSHARGFTSNYMSILPWANQDSSIVRILRLTLATLGLTVYVHTVRWRRRTSPLIPAM